MCFSLLIRFIRSICPCVRGGDAGSAAPSTKPAFPVTNTVFDYNITNGPMGYAIRNKMNDNGYFTPHGLKIVGIFNKHDRVDACRLLCNNIFVISDTDVVNLRYPPTPGTMYMITPNDGGAPEYAVVCRSLNHCGISTFIKVRLSLATKLPTPRTYRFVAEEWGGYPNNYVGPRPWVTMTEPQAGE